MNNSKRTWAPGAILLASAFWAIWMAGCQKDKPAPPPVPPPAPPHRVDREEAMATLKPYSAHRVSSADLSGGNLDYWPLATSSTLTLAELRGPGAIVHLWMTFMSSEEDHLRKLVLRIAWDGEKTPSVESPVGDFFGLGHGRYYEFSSEPITIGVTHGMNCYWFMPFSRSARITLANEGNSPVERVYFQADWRRYAPSEWEALERAGPLGRFHAHYLQRKQAPIGGEYEILSARGRGHYVGCNLGIQLHSAHWWGEGDDRFFIDGQLTPTLQGTGTEDYFGGAWNFFGGPFSAPSIGCPLHGGYEKGALWNVYRFHLSDPIPFQRSIRIAFELHKDDVASRSPNDYSSVAYWYQTEPHEPFGPLPPVRDRLPNNALKPYKIAGAYEAEKLTVAEMKSTGGTCRPQTMSHFGEGWSGGAQMLLQFQRAGDWAALEFDNPADGLYAFDAWLTRASNFGVLEIYLDQDLVTAHPFDGYSAQVLPSAPLQLGTHRITAGRHIIRIFAAGKNSLSRGFEAGLDCFTLNPPSGRRPSRLADGP